jgi:hypothetical protein
MKHCPQCQHAPLQVNRVHCTECGISVEGTLETPALHRLPPKETLLAEKLILHGGNLKSLAEELDITYPTLRKRLDEMITTLNELRREDAQQIDHILQQMEHQQIPTAEGIRRIKELNHEA